MAKTNQFISKVKTGFNKFGNSVEKAADGASLRIKVTAIDGKLNDYFLEFGKLTYESMRGNATEETQKRMETLVAMIDGKTAERKSLEAELAKRRAEAEAAKAEREKEREARKAEEAAEPAPDAVPVSETEPEAAAEDVPEGNG